MEDLQITLASPTKVFSSNQEVSGAVSLRTGITLKAKRIELEIIGRAKTGFTEVRGRAYCYYTAETDYIKIEKILWDSNGTSKLIPGNYEYPFSFMIPPTAPANLTEKFGSIQYYIKATVIVPAPWGSNKEAICEISVTPVVDLNLDPRLGIPVDSAIQKTGLLSSKAINLTVSEDFEKGVTGTTSVHQVQ